MSGITTALAAFKVDCGRYPSTSEGLDALLSFPTNSSGWRGPYADAAMITDLWKHRYIYWCPGLHNTNGFDLYTCGLDGISKTSGSDPDDINNWDPASPHGGDYFNHEGGHRYGLILLAVGIVAVICFFGLAPRQAKTMGIGQ